PLRPFRASLPALAAFPLGLWTRLAGREARRLGLGLLGEIEAAGYLPLRQAIRDHLALARGLDCAVGQVAIVASVQQALDLVA
ncbi:PLP-dependent aminotransferase family protein, partial [Acinetobacter baumannii]